MTPDTERQPATWHFRPGSRAVPLIIAHRGDLKGAPENTMPAFRKAVGAGADGIELDVWLTRDDELVVFHDRWLHRTSDGRGLVDRHTIAELRSLDVGSWFAPRFQGESPPTLDEVFETLPRDYLIDVEMKAIIHNMKRIAHRVAETIRRHQRRTSTLVASFNPVALYHLRRIDPSIARGYIWSKRHPLPIRARFLSPLVSPHWYDPTHHSYSSRLHRKFHQRGHRVLAWDMDFNRDLRRMAAAGLDGVVTDNLAGSGSASGLMSSLYY